MKFPTNDIFGHKEANPGFMEAEMYIILEQGEGTSLRKRL